MVTACAFMAMNTCDWFIVSGNALYIHARALVPNDHMTYFRANSSNDQISPTKFLASLTVFQDSNT